MFGPDSSIKTLRRNEMVQWLNNFQLIKKQSLISSAVVGGPNNFIRFLIILFMQYCIAVFMILILRLFKETEAQKFTSFKLSEIFNMQTFPILLFFYGVTVTNIMRQK